MRLPDLKRPNRYEHRRPHRPSHLPKRLTPPPERDGPPDLSLFLAIPYVVGYLFEVLF
jgi:hypothetical protein